MNSHSHNGTTFETLHLGIFVRCEICGRWRLRRKRDIFWKMTFEYRDLRPKDE